MDLPLRTILTDREHIIRWPGQPPPRQRTTSVYECPVCSQRYLGEQRCTDCNVFCRRLGAGGECPHCGDPVTITDITPKDQSAR